MATGLFERKSIPITDSDETPDFDFPEAFTGVPDFPDATPDAPYGYKPNGEPYKRRPNGAGPGVKRVTSTGRRMPASESQARTAASLLARLNALIGFGFVAANMPGTAEALAKGNQEFEELAYQALLTDPQLCKRILGAGATSGKAGLVMAYGMLGVSIFPAARVEVIENRKAKYDEEYSEA